MSERIGNLLAIARGTRGFLLEREGEALHAAGRRGAAVGPLLEVGSWCGRSTVFLGAAAEAEGTVLFAVDHHRGSEEQQAGWEHHDPSVVDPGSGRIDTLPFLRRTLAGAALESTVVIVVGDSPTVATHWGPSPLGLVFVDGGHGSEPAHRDYESWSPRVGQGGLLAIHDVFPDPADGGRPPYEIYRRALSSGEWSEVVELAVGSLRVLRRLREPRC